MTLRRLLPALPALAVALAVAGGCDGRKKHQVEVLPGPADARKIVRIAASDENVHLFRKLIEDYSASRDTAFEIVQSQSIDIPELVRKGAAGLGVMVRPVRAPEKIPDLNYVPFAWDGAVFVAGAGAGVSALTSAQVADIYAGRITNWKQVGGRDLMIRVIDRPAYSSIRKAVASVAGKPLGNAPSALVIETSEAVLHAVRTVEGGIACVPLSRMMIERFPVELLAIDGHPPVMSPDRNLRYPVPLEYALLFRKGAPEAIQELANHFVSVDGIHRITSLALVPAAGNIPIASCHCRSTDEAVAPARKSPLSGTLTIGVTPELGAIAQEKRYLGISRAIAEKVDVETRVKHLISYDEVVHAFLENRIDAAFVGSLAYARLKTQVGVVAIARPEKDGVSWYRGVIVVRPGDRIRSIRDLKGKRFAYVPDTSAGELFMRERAVKAGGREAEAFFGQLVKARSHAEAVRLVADGKVDGAAVKDLVLRRIASDEPGLAARIVEVERSATFPENALVVSPSMGDRQLRRLSELLLSLNASPAGREALEALGADRFVPTSDADYANVFELARETGYRLGTR